MKHRYAITMTTLLAIGGCTTGCTGGGDDPAGTPTTRVVTVTADPTPAGPQGSGPIGGKPGRKPVPAYTDVRKIIAVISTAVPCKIDGKPMTTLYSDRAAFCTYTAPDGVEDAMTVSTYTSVQQQQDATDMILGPDSPQPGVGVVMGPGWTVDVAPRVAIRVAKATGGTYLPPEN
jgi:hypothetical protein